MTGTESIRIRIGNSTAQVTTVADAFAEWNGTTAFRVHDGEFWKRITKFERLIQRSNVYAIACNDQPVAFYHDGDQFHDIPVESVELGQTFDDHVVTAIGTASSIQEFYTIETVDGPFDAIQTITDIED